FYGLCSSHYGHDFKRKRYRPGRWNYRDHRRQLGLGASPSGGDDGQIGRPNNFRAEGGPCGRGIKGKLSFRRRDKETF
ncbi:MAG: hypothetical protein OXB88_06970, partial [Bacteriovoracales bacterium]|nr:hypothetical protein [Bacteriovoracales bacterium]